MCGFEVLKGKTGVRICEDWILWMEERGTSGVLSDSSISSFTTRVSRVRSEVEESFDIRAILRG